ncbi:MAG: MFS transporter [Janthinobacterium lividum]
MPVKTASHKKVSFAAMFNPKQRFILPLIVFSQFACTSLWFAANAVMPDLVRELKILPSAIGFITSSVMLGFIAGTLVFALFAITDRFSPSKVFFINAILAAIFNISITFGQPDLTMLLLLRFITGFFLAGIYPVGMKIAADHFANGLGKALGFLVGALVLGTAFPHFLKAFGSVLPWKYLIIATSACSVLGGLLVMFFVPDGPFRQINTIISFKGVFSVFQKKDFRAAALGYFGHMWEIYTVWAFLPLILQTYLRLHSGYNLNISLFSFLIIASGSIADVIGGYLSQSFGSKMVAATALLLSGLCCVLSPLFFQFGPILFLSVLFFWNMNIAADSPQFSTLTALNAPSELKGSALTLVNCIGFSITIISIQLTNSLVLKFNPVYVFPVLALGPILGLIALKPKFFSAQTNENTTNNLVDK